MIQKIKKMIKISQSYSRI